MSEQKRQEQEIKRNNDFAKKFGNFDLFNQQALNFSNNFANYAFLDMDTQYNSKRSLLTEFNSNVKDRECAMMNAISSTTNSECFEPIMGNTELKASTSDFSRSISPLSQISLNKDMFTDSSSGVFSSSAISPKSNNSSSSTMDSEKSQFNSFIPFKEVFIATVLTTFALILACICV